MKKVMKSAVVTLVILAVLTGVGIYFLMKDNGTSESLSERMKQEQSDLSSERVYRYDLDDDCVVLKTNGDDKNVLNFNQNNVYEVATSDAARGRLDRLIKRLDSGFDEPIIALNPFGTNPNSLYFYFKLANRAMIRYTIAVADDNTPDFVRYVNSGMENNLSEVHEFTLSGLIPGQTNYIIIEAIDSTGAQRERKVFKFDAPKVNAPLRLKTEQGNSREQISNGLYVVMPTGTTDIYTYDNRGWLRNVTVTESNHGTRFYQSGNEVLYQVAANKVAKVSAIGRVTGVAVVNGVTAIKDFAYDGYDNIYSLATVKGRDCLLATSFDSGRTKTVYQFKKGITAKSLSTPDAGTVLVAMASPAGLMKLNSIASMRTSVSYILGKKSEWKKFGYKKKLTKDVTVSRWDTANSYLVSDETKGNYSIYVQDQGTGTALSFTIDEKEKKVSVTDTFPVAQKGNGRSEKEGEHYLISNGSTGIFSEYDQKGRITTKFSYGGTFDSVTKLTFDRMCFYGAS